MLGIKLHINLNEMSALLCRRSYVGALMSALFCRRSIVVRSFYGSPDEKTGAVKTVVK